MADGGWIKIYRSLRTHWLWENGNEKYAKWWIDILMMVNHKPRKVLVNGQLITIGVGERLTSLRKLAAQWNANTKTVSNFLTLLANDKMIELKKSRTTGTTIKVCHYADYQSFSDENETPNDTANTTHSATHTGHKQEPKNDKKKTPSSDVLLDRFNALWKLYPKKLGKQNSFKAYKKAIKDGATDDQIKTGIEAYVKYLTKEQTDPQYIKQGSSFFNQHSWEDDWSGGGITPEPPVSKGKTKAAAALREIQDEMANYPDTPREEAAQLAARAITENGHPTTADKILGFLDKMEKEGVSNE
jgi:DNA-binding transcriptional regulator YhcF (GntR family)